MQDKTNFLISLLKKKQLTEQELHAIESEIQSADFDPNQQDPSGCTPLMWAAHSGHSCITRILINNKRTRLDIKNENGSTVAYFAAQGGDSSVIEELLDKKLDFISPDKLGNTPLHYLVSKMYDPDSLANVAVIVERLIELGTDVHAKNKDNWSPIHDAIRCMPLEDVKAIFKDPEIQTEAQKCFALRSLSNVFNDDRLLEFVHKQVDQDYTNSGLVPETVNYVKPMLEKFLFETQLNTENQFQPLLDALQTLNGETDINQHSEKLSLILTGYKGHSIYCLIRPMEYPNLNMLLAERGFFADCDANLKANSIASATIFSQDRGAVIKKLLNARESNMEDAAKIIFKEIPEQHTLNGYSALNVKQKIFKRGRCYYENMKTILFAEFIEHFGDLLGRIIYKQFDIYMHEAALQFYINSEANFSDPYRNEIIDICKDIIVNKKIKLEKIKKDYDWSVDKLSNIFLNQTMIFSDYISGIKNTRSISMDLWWIANYLAILNNNSYLYNPDKVENLKSIIHDVVIKIKAGNVDFATQKIQLDEMVNPEHVPHRNLHHKRKRAIL